MFFLNMKDTESLLSLFNDLIGGLVIIYKRQTATNQYISGVLYTTYLVVPTPIVKGGGTIYSIGFFCSDNFGQSI